MNENDEIELTDAQWEIVKNQWNSRPNNPPSIQELIEAVFNKKDLDGRTREGRAIRRRLAQSQLKMSSNFYKSKNLLPLKDEDETFIINHYKTMRCVEIAEVIFNKKNLTNLSQEVRTIVNFLKENRLKQDSFEDVDDIATVDHTAPKTIEGAIKKVNKYKHEPLIKDRLTGKQKKDLHSLVGYLNTYRFLRQINTYNKKEDRELFESTFIRYAYDKYDLTEEEVDQYILLSTEVVIAASIQSRIESLSRLLDNASEQEDPKISMSLVEAIGTAQTEYNQCVTRQSKLLDSLKVKRSEKEGKNKDGVASILNLIQLMQDETTRVKMIKLAEKRKEKLKDGVYGLMSMDELKARLIGISVDDILNG